MDYTETADVYFVAEFYGSTVFPSAASLIDGFFLQAWHLRHLLDLLE